MKLEGSLRWCRSIAQLYKQIATFKKSQFSTVYVVNADAARLEAAAQARAEAAAAAAQRRTSAAAADDIDQVTSYLAMEDIPDIAVDSAFGVENERFYSPSSSKAAAQLRRSEKLATSGGKASRTPRSHNLSASAPLPLPDKSTSSPTQAAPSGSNEVALLEPDAYLCIVQNAPPSVIVNLYANDRLQRDTWWKVWRERMAGFGTFIAAKNLSIRSGNIKNVLAQFSQKKNENNFFLFFS